MISTSPPSYLKPLHEPFLNDIQKALMNAYLAWSGEREPSWIRICSVLRDFAAVLPGATKDSVAKYLISNDWSEDEPYVHELYNLMDKYTKHIRSGSFQHFLSNVKPDDIKPPKLSAEQECILLSETLKVVDQPLIRMSLAQKSCYVVLRTQQQRCIVLEMDEKTLTALRDQLNATIKTLENA